MGDKGFGSFLERKHRIESGFPRAPNLLMATGSDESQATLETGKTHRSRSTSGSGTSSSGMSSSSSSSSRRRHRRRSIVVVIEVEIEVEVELEVEEHAEVE